MKRIARETIFFILTLLLYFLSVKATQYWIHSSHLKPDLAYFIVGIVFVMLIATVFYISKMNRCIGESFWDVAPAAKCRGGPYMWQGDSETAQACRAMADTPEGRCAISSYNCPTGYNGVPKLPFVFSPLSGDTWENEQCKDKGICGCPYDEGLCSMEQKMF